MNIATYKHIVCQINAKQKPSTKIKHRAFDEKNIKQVKTNIIYTK